MRVLLEHGPQTYYCDECEELITYGGISSIKEGGWLDFHPACLDVRNVREFEEYRIRLQKKLAQFG